MFKYTLFSSVPPHKFIFITIMISLARNKHAPNFEMIFPQKSWQQTKLSCFYIPETKPQILNGLNYFPSATSFFNSGQKVISRKLIWEQVGPIARSKLFPGIIP